MTAPAARALRVAPSRRLLLLVWAFTAINSLRVLAYLPTIGAIHVSGNRNQHSLWTWGTFFGANLTMALWLHEQGGRRVGAAVLVSAPNAATCAVVLVLMVVNR